MMHRVNLSTRLALLFAACTAAVSLGAGVLFTRASADHFVELDRQLLEARLSQLRSQLQNSRSPKALAQRLPALRVELSHQADFALRIDGPDGTPWLVSRSGLPVAQPSPELDTLQVGGVAYRSLSVPLATDDSPGPRLSLFLDITHHQHFLQGMQRLIWLTVGLSALATAVLGAWAARRALRPLRHMGAVAASVSARSLTTRLPMAELPGELAALGETVNAMLQRLEEAFQRLSAFSADIAHELRTPLSNLLTQTQVVLSQPRSLDAYRDALHGNLEDVQRLTQLVNDMLFLAKADHGLLTLGDGELVLDDEVDALLEYYTPLAEEAGVRLHRVGEARLRSDRQVLRRALSNLLDNALRYTPAGGEIRVSLRPGVEIEVANTGTPIAPEALPRLFERFYRADLSRDARQGEHAGLGLAITRSIVRAHGGDIGVVCEGGWTRFVVRVRG